MGSAKEFELEGTIVDVDMVLSGLGIDSGNDCARGVRVDGPAPGVSLDTRLEPAMLRSALSTADVADTVDEADVGLSASLSRL